jgi:glycosyltransferase involved in cell wall biosynthesis
MRVALVDSHIAFISGGAEMLLSSLTGAIRAHGHDVEVIRIPLNPANPGDIERVMDFSLGEDLGRYIATPDIVIGLRFPGYLVRHPDKRMWLLHQLRQYYEYYGETRAAGNAQAVDSARSRILAADREALLGTRKVWGMSRRIVARAQVDLPDFDPPILYPPLPEVEGFYRGRQEMYIYAPSRLEHHKRQWLLIEAMAHVKSGVKAVISGEGGRYHAYLKQVADMGLSDRVLILGKIPRATQAAWYANCLGVFFCPEDEDYGYITLEGMLSGKPVITARDSGATLEFIDDGVEGLVVDPDPAAIAERIDWLAGNLRRAQEMGAAGYDRLRKLDLTWERTASVLLQREATA